MQRFYRHVSGEAAHRPGGDRTPVCGAACAGQGSDAVSSGCRHKISELASRLHTTACLELELPRLVCSQQKRSAANNLSSAAQINHTFSMRSLRTDVSPREAAHEDVFCRKRTQMRALHKQVVSKPERPGLGLRVRRTRLRVDEHLALLVDSRSTGLQDQDRVRCCTVDATLDV